MAKPNYQFEKRQKEMAKKQKNAEKALRKAAGKSEEAPAEDLPEGEAPVVNESTGQAG